MCYSWDEIFDWETTVNSKNQWNAEKQILPGHQMWNESPKKYTV